MLKVLPAMLALIAVPAFAAPVPIKQPVKLPVSDSCAQNMNGRDRAVCLAPVLDSATKSLDSTIAQLKTHFKAGDSYDTLFDASQDSWTKEMAQTCQAVEQFYDGGDIRYSVGIDCQIRMTRDREALIKNLYNVTLYH